ncbi:RidA family protein (plasmid) [Sphingobium sp. SJ10-10]|uniref:RidA family protein n=1 Tax=Sphingobium sp. SJ10-10 TaxID=3114999 RepID=UPI002E18BB5C|nr:RidA family protein [Sphingobium sp. SJ10-10]
MHAGVVYLSGQIAAPGEDVAVQTRAVLNAIDTLLQEAGSDRAHLLQATIWLSDMADFPVMNEIWEKWLTDVKAPARATGEVKLASPDYKIEILVTAALR